MSDARTGEDTGTNIDLDANLVSNRDASRTIDAEDEDANGEAADAEFDATIDADETDAAIDADETDTTPLSDAADDVGGNGCDLSGASYEVGEAAALSGTLAIAAAHSESCAAIDGDSLALGAVVVQQSCDYSPSQLWEPIDLGGGWFVLRSVRSGHYIGSRNGDTSEGVEVVQWDDWYSDTQQYQAVCAGSDQWRIVNRASGLSLTVENASTADGAWLTGRTDETQANQRFWIESQPEVFVPIVPTSEQGASTTWRYTTNSPPSDWNEEGFDDSGWTQGPGGFGEGDDRGNIGTLWNTGDIWLRTTFELSSPLPSDASLRIFHDEGAEIYINGVVAFSDSAWISGYLQAELGSSANDALQVGTNVIAVHCRNTVSPQYIDVGFGSYAWNP